MFTSFSILSTKLANFITSDNYIIYVIMKKIFEIKTVATPLAILGLLLLTGSCTVYRYDNASSEDGIYSRSYRGAASNYAESQNYYKQYFQSKQGAYSEILEYEDESALFTDIESYSTRDYIAEDGYIYTEEVPVNEEQYAGWGNNTTSISINLYGNGYYNPWYNSYYGYWGYPYYRYGFYHPGWYGGFGWHGGIGFGWGWGGYYNPYYYYTSYYLYYNRPYYTNASYNRGRRNSDYYSSRTSALGRSSTNSALRGRTNIDTGRRSSTINTTR